MLPRQNGHDVVSGSITSTPQQMRGQRLRWPGVHKKDGTLN
jgi:hypothetical protein